MGGFDQFYVSYYEDIDLGFRIRWAGYRCVFNPRCRILHEISATYNHGSPALQRLIARNAELVFWSNMPAGRLAAAIVPHALLLLAQAGWRMARLRFIPFFLGKVDAVRSARSIQHRRRIRADLARNSIAPAHFPAGSGLDPGCPRPPPTPAREVGDRPAFLNLSSTGPPHPQGVSPAMPSSGRAHEPGPRFRIAPTRGGAWSSRLCKVLK